MRTKNKHLDCSLFTTLVDLKIQQRNSSISSESLEMVNQKCQFSVTMTVRRHTSAIPLTTTSLS